MNPIVIDWYPQEEGGKPRIVMLDGLIYCVHGRCEQREQLDYVRLGLSGWRQYIDEGRVDYDPI